MLGKLHSWVSMVERLDDRSGWTARRRHRRHAGGPALRARTRCRARPPRSRPGRPSRPPPSHQARSRQPRAHRAGMPAFRHLRRLRGPALGRSALPRLEARPRHRGAGAGGARCAGRKSDRCPRRGPPPRRVPRAARLSATCSRSDFRALKAHRVVAIDRCPILAPGLDGRDRGRLGHRRSDRRRAQAARHCQVTATDAGLDVDVRGSGPLPAARHCRSSAAWPNAAAWRVSRATASLLRSAPRRPFGSAAPT